MRRLLLAAVFAAGLGLAAAVPAGADPDVGPPYIADAHWVHYGDLSSLRVYPTPAGRHEAGIPGTDAQGAEAWHEVLALSPEASSPGMREQFMCHWDFAELFEPGKASWNLEPWRPQVDDQQMIAAGCNPGGSEEPF